LIQYSISLFRQLKKETKCHDSSNENPGSETTKDFAVGIEVQTALEHKLISPQVNTNKDFAVGIEVQKSRAYNI